MPDIHTPDIFEILQQRGMVQDCTDVEGFRELTGKQSVTLYNGFDPTADCLHIGNLVPILALVRFQQAGHRPIVLVGGATGMIGDPSGKNVERNLLDLDQVRANVDAQAKIFSRFIKMDGPNAGKVVNNYDWLGKMGFLEFLRDVGKYFRIGEMLGKESVRKRVLSEGGLSFTEFSYMMLQAYDFKYLLETENCQVQSGGADQWGNITAGTDLIRRTVARPAFGITYPLLTTASGAKFGKSEAGAVWLDSAKTPVYDFYQYWVRTEDADIERLLKIFTFLPLEEITEVVAKHNEDPGKRTGQKRLAWEATAYVHSPAEADKAREAAEALFETALTNLSDARLRELFPDVPSISISRPELEAGAPVPDILVRGGLASSKKEALRLLAQNGLYLNQQPFDGSRKTLNPEDLASESMLLLRAGKKRFCLVKVEG